MTDYFFICAKKAKKDYKEVKRCKQKYNKLMESLDKMKKNPLCPTCEPLKDKLKGLYSRRLNKKDRLVYDSRMDDRVVIIESMLTHYEGIHCYSPMSKEKIDELRKLAK